MSEMTYPAPAPIEAQAIAGRASQIELDEWNTPDADEVEGFDLLKDDALFQLVGVPFMATRVVFRDGILRKGSEVRDDYVSIETHVAPAAAWDLSRIQSRRRIMGMDPNSAMAKPDEQLVVNDGSTGLYRQIVQYLAAKNLIVLPEGDEEGEKGESILDLPRSAWQAGSEEATEGIDIKLRCSRGLRFSEYQNEYTGGDTARTWYLA